MGRRWMVCAVFVVTLVLLSACSREAVQPASLSARPCDVALAPHAGDLQIDKEIANLQQESRRLPTTRTLERLGWLFVSKARLSYDSGYYELAEQCADCIESKSPGSPEALLLRGHVLHNMHRFKEGEKIARELVSRRGGAFDYGVLGDVLMEQGRLLEAAEAYQKMVDLKPGLQSYSRAAHLRWLKGDLEGARELMRMAARAGSPRDPESVAWAYSRLALYELQASDSKRAAAACDAALSYQADYAPALLVQGRLLLAQGKSQEAVVPLKRAASLNPQAEYAWVLAEALHAAGRIPEARSLEESLEKQRPVSDPRTFALFLATRGRDAETALRLAEDELKARADVFTLDALAWALAAAGRLEEAESSMRQALAHGTQDARLFYHAGSIAAASGRKPEARRWLERAAAIRQMLLPSEREQLTKQLASL